MKFLISILLPIFLYAGEYFAKVEPFEEYTISSKSSGLVTYTNENLISNIAKNQTLVKIDDEISKINYEVALSTYKIKKNFYQKIQKLSTRSKLQKDNEKIVYLNAKQAYIRAKDDFESRNIKAKGLYIEDILVKKGNFVNPGTPLIKAYDINKSKITIYVTKEDIKDIKFKNILVNGKSDFKLYKYFKIADKVQVSSFKVILTSNTMKNFSDIVKVEIK